MIDYLKKLTEKQDNLQLTYAQKFNEYEDNINKKDKANKKTLLDELNKMYDTIRQIESSITKLSDEEVYNINNPPNPPYININSLIYATKINL